MQAEIEVFNLKYLETWSLKYFVKNLYISMVKLRSNKIKCIPHGS